MNGSEKTVTDFIVITNGSGKYRLWDTVSRDFYRFSNISSVCYGQPVEYETKEEAKKMAQRINWTICDE